MPRKVKPKPVKVRGRRMGDGRMKLTAYEIPELAEIVTKMGTPPDVLRRIMNGPRTKQVLMGIMNGRLHLNGKETELTKFKRLEAERRGKTSAVVAAERAAALQRKHAALRAVRDLSDAEKAHKAEIEKTCRGWSFSTLVSLPREELKKLAHDKLVYVLVNSGVATRDVVAAFKAAVDIDELAYICVTDEAIQKVDVSNPIHVCQMPLSYLSRVTLLQFIFHRSGQLLMFTSDDGHDVPLRTPLRKAERELHEHLERNRVLENEFIEHQLALARASAPQMSLDQLSDVMDNIMKHMEPKPAVPKASWPSYLERPRDQRSQRV
jgi:hypothetical protein